MADRLLRERWMLATAKRIPCLSVHQPQAEALLEGLASVQVDGPGTLKHCKVVAWPALVGLHALRADKTESLPSGGFVGVLLITGSTGDRSGDDATWRVGRAWRLPELLPARGQGRPFSIARSRPEAAALLAACGASAVPPVEGHNNKIAAAMLAAHPSLENR